jgi:zinc/manganese transport system substrate-binding protein
MILTSAHPRASGEPNLATQALSRATPSGASRVVVALLAVLAFASSAAAQNRLPVVASFSIIGDFVREVGGDRVSSTNLVGPNGDAHVYTPSPADAKTIADAKLVIVNGLGFEGWLPRLVKSSGSKAKIVAASDGIASRKAGREADPHAWQSVANAKIYVANIRDALTSADPAGADAYRSNADGYLKKLDALDAEIRAAVATIPPERRKVISSHDAFGYFTDAYGIAFIAPLGTSTNSEAGAKDLAAIIRQVKASKIPAVFLEQVSDPRLIARISAETGAAIGGTLYSDTLTAENGDAPTYIAMVTHNIRTLTRALAK